MKIGGKVDETILLHLRGEKLIKLEHYEQGQRKEIPIEHMQAHVEFDRLARNYPHAYLAWHDVRLAPFLSDVCAWHGLLRHPLELLHLSCFQRCDLMVNSVGFVDHDSPFLLAGPTDRRYPTWLISPMCGIGHAATFKAGAFDPSLGSFSLAILAFGLRAIQFGLCPYSEPGLLARPVPSQLIGEFSNPLPAREIAKLIKVGYGRRWVLFWLACNLLFKRSLPLLSLPKALAASSPQTMLGNTAEQMRLHPPLPSEIPVEASIDAIIPTLDRPGHVANVLRDLAAQSLIPRRVLIVEQAAESGSTSKLVALAQEEWPFQVELHSVPWVGVCRARNLALRQVESEWVLFLDDDVRLPTRCVQSLLAVAQAYCVDAVNAAVYLPHQEASEVSKSSFPRLSPSFASGASLVSNRAIRSSNGFDERLEGGYGEDYEFGVRLRLTGANVLYAPGAPVLHLKAPSGGFRHKVTQPWEHEKVQLRPSPTVLFSRRKHITKAMQQGYMAFYWARRLTATPIYRWPLEIITIARQWRNSVIWARRIARQEYQI